MDFQHLDATYPIVAAVFLLLIAAQAWLVNRKRGWLGAFVPAIYFALLMFLGVTDRISSLTDFVFAALGLLGLLAWWISVRDARRRRIEDRTAFPPQSAANPGDSLPPSSAGARRQLPLIVS